MNAPLPPDAVAVAMLPVAQIAESATNPRKHFDETYLAELAESIKSHGVIQPITVRPHSVPGSPWPYELVVGACRLRAAERAGLDTIPGFWRELDDKSVLEIQVIENLQRRDVSEIEEADGYRMLMDRHGYTADQIAEKIGKSRAYVYARLKLTALCEAGRDAFYAKLLDASTALLVARIRGETLQKKAVKALTTEGYGGGAKSFRDAKYYIKNQFTVSLKQATFKLDDATLVAEAGTCTACPLRSGNDLAIFADIEDGDVCTDTTCYENKRQARRDQLIAIAEKRKLPVLSSRDINFTDYDGPDSDEDGNCYVCLDDVVPGDAEERTYRQILGDKAPVNALVETGYAESDKNLEEFALPSALAKALKKAGWAPAPAETKSNTQPDEAAEANAEREAKWLAKQAEDRARKQVADAEKERRQQLQNQIAAILRELPDTATATTACLAAVVLGMLDRDFTDIETPDELLEQYGHPTPDPYDQDIEIPRAISAMREWPIGKLTAFALEYSGTDHDFYGWKPEEKTVVLDPLAEILGLSTPSPAAQAHGEDAKPETKAKKTKAKAATAATSSPNEPAAPVETSSTLLPAWPFPTGSRP